MQLKSFLLFCFYNNGYFTFTYSLLLIKPVCIEAMMQLFHLLPIYNCIHRVYKPLFASKLQHCVICTVFYNNLAHYFVLIIISRQ